MRRRRIIAACVVLFIGINILLLVLDKTGKVERKSYVKNWSETVEMDMYEQLDKQGVFISSAEEDIYFDKALGTFADFLVAEGDEVYIGDELYTYRVHNYYETERLLQRNSDTIQGEIEAIQTAIGAMDSYYIQEAPLFSTFGEVSDDQQVVDLTSSSVEADLIKEQYKIEQEKELSRKNAELQAIEAELTDLRANGDEVAVASPYQGKVRSTSKQLNNPLITIDGVEVEAVAELTEKERLELEPGLAVNIYMTETDAEFEGIITSISNSPEAIEIDQPSSYTFNVALVDTDVEEEFGEGMEDEFESDMGIGMEEEFEEDMEIGMEEDFEADMETDVEEDIEAVEEELGREELLPGYHVDLEVITKEGLAVTAVTESGVFNNYLWKLTDDGKLTKQKAEIGMHMDQMAEVEVGAKPGNLVATASRKQFRAGSTFITPLKVKGIKLKQLIKTDKRNNYKHLILGILSR